MTLEIINQLLSDLKIHKITYCHWKSNEHLDAALKGDTDLDMLFDINQKSSVIEILKNNGFHLFNAVWYHRYNGIDDFIGFDKDAGKIIHVHTHFNLNIGETGIKSYHLPWEKMILQTRIFDQEKQIFRSSENIELLLLIVRTAFKHNSIDRKSNHSVSRHFNIEAKWLYERIDPVEFKKLSTNILGNDMAAIIEQIRITGRYDEALFINLKHKLNPYFAEHRILTKQRITYLKTVHFIVRIQNKIRKFFQSNVKKRKRTLPQHGVVLCIMGADGAGKSTQTKAITQELAKKIDVLFMYMGSGDGARSLQRRIIEAIVKIASKQHKARANQQNKMLDESNPIQKRRSSIFLQIKQIMLSIKAASLAFEKKNRLKIIDKKRKLGYIIVCDRYPQVSIPGYNDGPRLYSYIDTTNFLIRSLAKFEFKCYQLANKIHPDLVIKLTGSLSVLHSRRPEMSIEEIQKKQDGITNLQFGPSTQIVEIDIDKPITQIKGMILEELSLKIGKVNSD